MKKNHVFQFRLSDDVLKNIEYLEQRTSSDKAKVIRNSLHTLDWLIKMSDEGYSIQLKKDNEVITFPIQVVLKI